MFWAKVKLSPFRKNIIQNLKQKNAQDFQIFDFVHTARQSKIFAKV